MLIVSGAFLAPLPEPDLVSACAFAARARWRLATGASRMRALSSASTRSVRLEWPVGVSRPDDGTDPTAGIVVAALELPWADGNESKDEEEEEGTEDMCMS